MQTLDNVTMKFIPSLDGIRAIAVLLVVVYHGGYIGFGWIGVEIFFVLSGFLITGILLQDKQRFEFSGYLKRFYLRRALRIFPLYFGYLGLLAVAGILLGQWETLEVHYPSLLTYTYNIVRMMPTESVSMYYTHFWSLAIEEQFYLLWPFIVYFSSEKNLKRIVAILLISAPALRFLSVDLLQGLNNDVLWHGRFIYTFTLTQADAFAWGALLCLVDLSRVRKPLFWISVALVLLSGIINLVQLDNPGNILHLLSLGYPAPEHLTQRNLQYVWGYSLIGFCSAMSIACCRQFRHPFLENRLLTWIGKISYGIYVFHLPLLAIKISLINWRIGTIYSPIGVAVFVCYLVLVILVSSLSYRYFEAWFLGLKNRCMPYRHTDCNVHAVASTDTQ